MEKRSKKKIFGISTVLTIGALGALAWTFPGAFGLPPREPPQKDMAIDSATRSEAIESAIALLNQHYVFPEKAAALEKQLRSQMQHGDFDSISAAGRMWAYAHELEIHEHPVDKDLTDAELAIRRALEVPDVRQLLLLGGRGGCS